MELWKRTVYVCAFGVFLSGAGLSQVGPIMPLYLQELGVQNKEEIALWSGLAMGIMFIVVAMVAPFWGKLADKKGRKLILLRASLGLSITNLVTAFVTSPEQLVLCRVCQGLISGFYPGAITLVASECPKDRSGWALGLLSSANVAGALLGPLIGGYLSSIFGYRGNFVVISSVMFVSFLLSVFFVKESYVPDASKRALSFKEVLTELPYAGNIAIMTLTGFVFSAVTMSLQPLLTVYVMTLEGVNLSHLAFISGVVFSATGLAQMLASVYLGKMIDRIGSYKILMASLVFSGLLSIPQAYVSSVTELTIVRFMLGLAFGGMLPASNAYISTHTPKHLTGQIFSYTQMSNCFGFFLGGLGGAYLMSTLGFTPLFWVTALLFFAQAYLVHHYIKPELPHNNKD